jgi:DNA mismatch repair protein MutS2
MLIPSTLENKIGFDTIKELLSEECLSGLGKQLVAKLKFTSNFGTIIKLVSQTNEFKTILQTESGFPTQYYIDINPFIAKAKIEGYFLEEEEFADLKRALLTIQQIFHFFKTKENLLYPTLHNLYLNALPNNDHAGWASLIKELDFIFDEKGKIRDSASIELANIRRKLNAELREVQKTLDRIYRTAKNSGWIAEDMTLSVRNGRLVIPILAEHKRKLNGFVHDESSTGQIAFVEPGEVFETNNEIRDLEIRERREIIRILTELTNTLKPNIQNLEQSNVFLGQMDFIRAKAKFAIKIDAVLPQIQNNPSIDWQNARHPLLYLSHQKLGKNIVPLHVKIDVQKHVLVVSGPNAGGKSVLLKTIALLQYMLQTGLLVPISPDAIMGTFADIFIDIGDEQSIESDLSTYSSHLTCMQKFLKHTTSKTLFLIDEFGSGTEPNVGGAIAEAILEELLETKAMGVINTHYTNLKVFADKHEGTLNCAMKFDGVTLSPLFELNMGQPGSSFAFEVAQKIGLSKVILGNAKQKISGSQLNFENLLRELESEKNAYNTQNQQIINESKELKAKIEQYNTLKTFLDKEQKRILNQAKEEAKQLLNQTNKTIEKTIKDIKEGNAGKERTKEIRQEIETFKTENLKPQVSIPTLKETFEKDESEWKVGDFVRIKGQETFGQITNLNGKEVEVMLGELKSNIKRNRLEKVSKKVAKAGVKENIRENLKGLDMNEKMTNFSYSVDIRGKRGEEAIIAVNDILDDAIVLGYPQIRILHGKGDGILRNLVRNHLKQYKQVKRITDEHADRGGQGISIVDMV